MLRWEYKILRYSSALSLGKLQESINRLGSDGWMIVSVVTRLPSEYLIYFKRPVE